MSRSNLEFVYNALDTLKSSIQFTKNNKPRQNVCREQLKKSIDQLRRIFRHAGILPSASEDRIDDPHWYLDTLVTLAENVTGCKGVRHLVETIVIIRKLLERIAELQQKIRSAAPIPQLHASAVTESITAVGNADDNASIGSNDKEMNILREFLNRDPLANRRHTLMFIRYCLEEFLNSVGCSDENGLLSMASIYNHRFFNGGEETWVQLLIIIRHGNDAAHFGALYKDEWIAQVRAAVAELEDFEVYLRSKAG